jgi:LacI family transcriptional regulator
MATIRDVAKRVGVSNATVSRALNKTGIVSEETREKILNAVAALDFTPSFLAKGMRSKKTNTFGIIIPDFSNLYYAELLKYLEREARNHDYIAIICTGQLNYERENEYIHYLLSRQIDGLILCCYTSILKNRERIKNIASKVPIVITDQPSFDLPVSSVYADGYAGFSKLLTYLINKGHKKIGIIRSKHIYPCSESRFQAYGDTIKKMKLKLHEGWIAESEFTAAGGYKAASTILQTRERPTAIVGVNDIIAVGALKYVTEHGFRVPDEIVVAGFDNIPLSSFVTPQLTTVSIPIELIAREAVQLLMRKSQNPRVRTREIKLETQLIIRQSTEHSEKQEILI